MMQMVNEKIAPVNEVLSRYPIRYQVLGLIGLEMFFVFLLWIIPPPITAPFDLAAFVCFLVIIAAIFKEFNPIVKYVKWYILLHVCILFLYLLVYEVIFNWIIKPGKKEPSLGILKVILILISCLVDGLLYIKWMEYTSSQAQPQTDFPDTVTSTDPNVVSYTADQQAYQDTQNY